MARKEQASKKTKSKNKKIKKKPTKAKVSKSGAITKKKQANTKSKSKKKVKATAKQIAFAKNLYAKLDEEYPDSHCALIHKDAFELLIATILSAQCTDKRVNIVTPPLFKKFPGPDAFAEAPVADIEEAVRSTGFYRNKAKNIKGASELIAQEHNGEVPATMDELLKLPGVARKTANVVLGNAFGINVGVVVDTHVGRLSLRLGLTKHEDPKKIELDLMARFAQDNWGMLSHLLIDHGRAVCSSRKPKCDDCHLADICPKKGVS
jgi:endonuclease-3